VGDAAYLVRAGDVQSLVAALRDFLNNAALQADLSTRGRAHILQQLSWDCVGKKMVNYYRQCLAEQQPIVKRHANH
jgi:glycosyltransferase involved in cell wall biosynthesis